QLDEKDERRSYFCPGDAKADDKATLIALDELYKELDKSPAGVKFVLVDACRNNPAQGRGANEVVRPPKGIIAMYSCSEGQRAYETATYKHGLFFHYVLEALRTEENQNERGDVTWDRLAGYVSRHVSEDAPKLVGVDVRQDPHIIVEVKGTSPVVFRPNANIRKAQLCRKRGLKAHADGDYDAALPEFTEGIKLNDKDPNLFAARGKTYVAKHEYGLAARDYSEALLLSPDSTELHLGRAEVYFEDYRHADAVRDLNEVIRIDPQSAVAYGRRSFCYYLMQEDERALKDADTAIQLAPKEPLGYAYRASVLIRMNKYDRALEDCNTALRVAPRCALALNCRGVIYA